MRLTRHFFADFGMGRICAARRESQGLDGGCTLRLNKAMSRQTPTRTRYTGPGITAGNMRANGVRNILVSCNECHHEALLNLDHMSDHVEIHSLDNRLVCNKCGSKHCNLMPNWREREERPSLTGNQYD
jgi:hypothetical protein